MKTTTISSTGTLMPNQSNKQLPPAQEKQIPSRSSLQNLTPQVITRALSFIQDRIAGQNFPHAMKQNYYYSVRSGGDSDSQPFSSRQRDGHMIQRNLQKNASPYQVLTLKLKFQINAFLGNIQPGIALQQFKGNQNKATQQLPLTTVFKSKQLTVLKRKSKKMNGQQSSSLSSATSDGNILAKSKSKEQGPISQEENNNECPNKCRINTLLAVRKACQQQSDEVAKQVAQFEDNSLSKLKCSLKPKKSRKTIPQKGRCPLKSKRSIGQVDSKNSINSYIKSEPQPADASSTNSNSEQNQSPILKAVQSSSPNQEAKQKSLLPSLTNNSWTFTDQFKKPIPYHQNRQSYPDYEAHIHQKKAFQQTLRNQLQARATLQRQNVRRLINEKSQKLGRPSNIHSNRDWSDGVLSRQLIRYQMKWESQYQEIQLIKKSMTKQKDSLISVEQQMKLQILQQEQKRLQSLANDLIEQRDEFFFQWRRFVQQESSIFLKNIQAQATYPSLDNGRYIILNLLGKGGFSQVYSGYDLELNCKIALKYHNIGENWPIHQKESYMKHAMRQSSIHAKMSHKNIIKCYCTVENSNKKFLNGQGFFTILEYCQGQDLLSHMRRNNGRIQQKQAKLILAQSLQALRYISQSEPQKGRESVIHYDIKPQNILIDRKTGSVKLSDFGLCKLISNQQADQGGVVEITSQGVGTYWYLPPQTFRCRTDKFIPTISQKVDIWSLGVVFFEMLYGVKPFGQGMSPSTIVHEQAILRAKQVIFPDELKKKKPQIPPSDKLRNGQNMPTGKYSKSARVSADAKEFIRNCLKYHQSDRYSVEDACNSKYMKDLMQVINGSNK